MFTALGILSGILLIIADLPYAWHTYTGKIKPHRTSWSVIFGLSIINFSNQWASGATNSLWLYGAGVLMIGLIASLSLKHGTGGTSTFDIICMLLAVAGILLWLALKSPLASILSNIVASTVALLPTFRKAYLHPDSERHSTWIIASFSCMLAAISVGSWNVQLLLMPLQGSIIQLVLFSVLTYRTRVLKNT